MLTPRRAAGGSVNAVAVNPKNSWSPPRAPTRLSGREDHSSRLGLSWLAHFQRTNSYIETAVSPDDTMLHHQV